MPTYDWACTVCSRTQETFVPHMHPEPPVCCDQPMKKGFGGGSFRIKGESPSKLFRREREDHGWHRDARKARAMKKSGLVSMDEHLSRKDVQRFDPK